MYSNEIEKLILADQKAMKNCKTKEDLNNLWKDRKVIVKDGSDWDGEVCDFIEMVGSGKRENWKMKVRTAYGTHLELKGNQVIITVQKITTTPKEADLIKRNLESKGFNIKKGRL